MGDIAEEVLAAQRDHKKLNQLIADYLPFIKKQLFGLKGLRLDRDDMLSVAMLTFSGCVQQYDLDKGNFLAFCGVCIRNRLLDESRRQARYESKILPLFDGEGRPSQADGDASMAAYSMEREQTSLALEIEAFSLELKGFGIDFNDLPRVCPKQGRSRALCAGAAEEIAADPSMYQEFMKTGRLPQAALSARLGVSPKTLEKHRKFIVTLVILMAGDYPYIQAFLPDAGR